MPGSIEDHKAVLHRAELLSLASIVFAVIAGVAAVVSLVASLLAAASP